MGGPPVPSFSHSHELVHCIQSFICLNLNQLSKQAGGPLWNDGAMTIPKQSHVQTIAHMMTHRTRSGFIVLPGRVKLATSDIPEGSIKTKKRLMTLR